MNNFLNKRSSKRSRILWNRRPDQAHDPYDGGDIDEIVVHNCTVHIEQLGDNCWWIEITKDDTDWEGVFTTNGTTNGNMRFAETNFSKFVWDIDDTHETSTPWRNRHDRQDDLST